MDMNIKLVAFDLDGTLLRSDGSLREPQMAALERAVDAGYKVVPATGRSLAEIPDELMDLEGIRYVITANGASIMDMEEDREIFADLIPPAAGSKIFDALLERGIPFQAYSEGVTFCDERYMLTMIRFYGNLGEHYNQITERMRFVGSLPSYFKKSDRTIEKIYIHNLEGESRQEILRLVDGLDGIEKLTSNPVNLEINSATADKGAGLAQLCSGLGIPRENVMALGDGENDIGMIRFAGFSVAMGNAVPTLKKAASYVTVSNDDGGLEVAFRKFLGI